MYWAQLLHFYQPFGQRRDIIEAITAQCYRPVVEGVLANPRARLSINFTGVLLDQLAEAGQQEVIEMYAEAARRGHVELVATAKYHAILPLLPPEEARRQIELNHETNRRFFGDAYAGKGIFLPEMAWSPALAPVLEQCGIEWVMLDELAFDGKVRQVDYTKSYRVAGTKLRAVFREHRLSATIMSAAPRRVDQLKAAARADLDSSGYVVVGMDGETFGHHRIGHERLLVEMYKDPDFRLVRISDLFELYPEVEEVPTIACSWASSEQDLEKKIPYISWNDPDNPIHQWQWELVRLTVQAVERLEPGHHDYKRLRAELDMALASDQFFWASARPWWNVEHIESSAHRMAEILEAAAGKASPESKQSRKLYDEIMTKAWEWQRGGKIDDRIGRLTGSHPRSVRVAFKVGADEASWNALLEVLEQEEQAAAGRRDYEAAIWWRNAQYKLEQKLDIYDTEYILDILDKKLPQDRLQELVDKHRQAFDRIRGGQVEQRSN